MERHTFSGKGEKAIKTPSFPKSIYIPNPGQKKKEKYLEISVQR
jgi:hypothetical protein